MTDHHDFDKNYLENGKGFKSWFFTVDHKRLGVMYLWAIGIFFVLAAIASFLIRFEHLSPGQTIISAQTYNVLFTLHGAVMVFLFIVPGVAASFGNFLIPLMIGARDVIFPKLNLYSFWIYCAGSLILLLSLAAPVDTGWTFYTPYSIDTGTNVILVTFGVFVLGFSSILTGINFIVSMHKLRAPGLTWDRLPLFCWAAYATSLLQVLATPVVGITLLLLIGERYFGLGFFDPAKGGDPVLFQHIFWFFGHPEVYIMILPAFGIASHIIETFSRKQLFGYASMVWAMASIAILSFVVWAHHMFTVGLPLAAELFFMWATMLIAVPTGVKVFNWVTTMFKGSISYETPMLFAIAFVVLFTIGGFSGLMLAITPADFQYHDTYFVVAHFHYVLVPGSIFSIMAAVYYWIPKWTGNMYDERLGKLHFWLSFIGVNVTFFPQHWIGLAGMPRRVPDYALQFADWNMISSVGAFLFGASQILFMFIVLKTVMGGKKATPQVWEGSRGLEWTVESPAPYHTFTTPPKVN